ncbi:vascular endothelial growth factor receptor kdr-like [Rhinophrynus dorsalis]
MSTENLLGKGRVHGKNVRLGRTGGSAPLTWKWQQKSYKMNSRLQVWEQPCEWSEEHLTCSQLTITQAQAKDTGYINCLYSRNNGNPKRQARIYLYVKDEEQPFLKMNTENPDVIYLQSEHDDLVIPCSVNSPDYKVTLRRRGESQVIHPGMKWDPKKGFTIPNPTYTLIHLLECVTEVKGKEYFTLYLPQGDDPNNRIVSVTATPTKLLVGDPLTLLCVGETDYNTRVVLEWVHRGKTLKSIKTFDRSQHPYRGTREVKINHVSMQERGEYTCRDPDNHKNAKSVRVTVYEKAFLDASPLIPPEITEGQKELKLYTTVSAFPQPQVTWLKDGKIIGANHLCYKPEPESYNLVIKNPSEKDSGIYTLVLNNTLHNLQNIVNFPVTVNVKPSIYEKEIDFDRVEPVLLGEKQQFGCTAYGKPPPRIHWEWQPCLHDSILFGGGQYMALQLLLDYYNYHYSKLPGDHLRMVEYVVSNWCEEDDTVERIPILPENTNTNLSVSDKSPVIEEGTVIHEGKNKTISMLTTSPQSNQSGIFFCVASNKAGTDRRSMRFILSEIKTGVMTEAEMVVVVGNDAKLVCRAEKYIYTNLIWSYPSGEQVPPHLTETFYEDHTVYFVLNLKNVKQKQAGKYNCLAENRYGSSKVGRQVSLVVLDKEAPQVVQELTDAVINSSGTLFLECRVNGTPTPNITWLKNDYVIKPASGITFLYNNTLIIERIKKDDEGLYKCQAANEMGIVSTSAVITIRGAEEKSNIEVIILVCTGVAATLFWLLLTLFIRKLKKPHASEMKAGYLSIIMDPDEMPLDEQCERLPYDSSKWEFPRDRLSLGKTLGHGAFGKVVEASAFGIDKCSTCKTVAVKMLKECATNNECKALMSELKILIHIGHHLNVVNLLGACTKPGGPLMVIVEYCKYGNLSNYLRSKRGDFIAYKSQEVEKVLDDSTSDLSELIKRRLESVASTGSSASSGFIEDKSYSDSEEEEEDNEDVSKRQLTMEDLICYSFQVAKGMEFLASRKCIHRDLAARNILLSENNVVKICDFGLARDIYKDPDYVRKGDARLPLKWMAPEAIFDKIYTTQSDVWSFGVLLWEIFSLGASPYPGVQIDEDFCCRLKEGTRMRSPEYCTPEIYQTMLDCWQGVPTDRPTFTDLVERLGDLLQANVQQEGKDYIPLNTALCLDGDPNVKAANENQNTRNSLTRWSALEAGKNIKNRPLSVKTFDEVPVGKDKVLNEESESDSGMFLSSMEVKSLKRQETRSWPFGIIAHAMKSSKSKESVLGENQRHLPKRHPPAHNEEDSLDLTLEDLVLMPMDLNLECHSPPPDYDLVMHYSIPPV